MSKPEHVYKIDANDLESWERLFAITNLEEQMRLRQIVVFLIDGGEEIPLNFNNVDRIRSQVKGNENVSVYRNLHDLARTTNLHPLFLDAETYPSPVAVAGLEKKFQEHLDQLVANDETIWNTLVTIKKGGPTADNLKTLGEVILRTLEPHKNQITQIKFAIVYDSLGPAHAALPVISRNFRQLMEKNAIEVEFFTDKAINQAQIWLTQ